MLSAASQSEPITRLLNAMHTGEDAVLARLFHFYAHHLRRIAESSLGQFERRVSDEDDLLAEVLGEFLMDGREGALPPFLSREDALNMLCVRVQQRARNIVRDAHCQKRGGGKVRGDSVFGGIGRKPDSRGFDRLPAPDVAVDRPLLLAEEVAGLHARFLACLSPHLAPVARLWLQGLTPAEIQAELQISQTSVYRKLNRILERFEQVFPGSQPGSVL